MSHDPDRLFAQPLARVQEFLFNEDVARMFPDMIKRSVTGYTPLV
ncbi:MAG TPA: carboxy-S-adenosyl-L-methionine synthase CmoA, partial [Pseudomonas sp.]|nr:carboxy-S-adenosyl-L-methionine synthase CmoA [Pseudomonas sp.]